mmetsp:Transcript_40553/g.100164  ORF Transcript_40553/g.100164 Transcript_40553/m.100164 type:complete len:127 (+) Transcript_40553:2240-2620(+)
MTSKWFVGSSSRRMSAFCNIARASASFMRQPPERVDTASLGRAAPLSWKPTALSCACTCSREMPYFWMPSSSSTYSIQVKCDFSPMMSASTKMVRTSSGSGKPSTLPWAIERMSVVLPQSFLPSRP